MTASEPRPTVVGVTVVITGDDYRLRVSPSEWVADERTVVLASVIVAISDGYGSPVDLHFDSYDAAETFAHRLLDAVQERRR